MDLHWEQKNPNNRKQCTLRISKMVYKRTVQQCTMKKTRTKKPGARKWPIEVPSLNNPNHVFDIYRESDSDVNYIEDFSKGEDKKNSKEYDYINMDVKKEGKQADLQKTNIMRYHHDITRKKDENEKALVTKEMGLGFLEKKLFYR